MSRRVEWNTVESVLRAFSTNWHVWCKSPDPTIESCWAIGEYPDIQIGFGGSLTAALQSAVDHGYFQ